MDGFHYVNIFETKGIEYLLTIAFFAMLIPFWLYLNKPAAIKVKYNKALGILTEKILNIPKGLFYNKNHTWAHLEKTGFATVGLDDFLLHVTGRVKIENLLTPGVHVKKRDVIARILQDGKHLEITSPISGKVEKINSVLNKNPEMINDDPYEKGWIAQIKPQDWQMETSTYLLAEDATEWAKNELARVKDFVAVSLKKISPEPSMVVLQDGGELMNGPLSMMPDKVWEDFQNEFLS